MEIKRNEHFEFQYWNDTNEYANDIDLIFRVAEDKSSLSTLHKMCKSFARTLGYLGPAIEEMFGADYEDRI